MLTLEWPRFYANVTDFGGDRIATLGNYSRTFILSNSRNWSWGLVWARFASAISVVAVSVAFTVAGAVRNISVIGGCVAIAVSRTKKTNNILPRKRQHRNLQTKARECTSTWMATFMLENGEEESGMVMESSLRRTARGKRVNCHPTYLFLYKPHTPREHFKQPIENARSKLPGKALQICKRRGSKPVRNKSHETSSPVALCC